MICRAICAGLVGSVLLAGCGSGSDDNAKLVQARYGDCLTKLAAKQEQAMDYYVTYSTNAGFLTFHVTKSNGKTYTLPDGAKDEQILATVGC